MNEEIRNRNNELNDAALEQVSGGTSEGSLSLARGLCEKCPARGTGRGGYHCEGGEEQLAEYFDDCHKLIFIWQQCPYLKQS